MAHGFLTPTPVTGESPLWRQLQKGFEKLLAAKIWPLSKKQDLIYAHVSDIQNLLKSGQQKKLTGSSKPALLGAGNGNAALPGIKPKGLLNPGKAGITKLDEKQIVVGKNATDIDRKEQKYLGTTDPDVAGGPKTRKGGTFTDIGSTPQTKPLNDTNFFSKAVNEGIDANTGQYLSKEARIAAFQAGKVERNQSQGPAISPDSGADIVAAVNRNTEAIIRLVDTTKEQTKNDSNIAQQQIQAQDTMMSRAAAKSEEAAAEQGSDLSGFLTPERFKRKDREEKEDKQEKGSKLKEFFRGPNPFKQPEGCGCSPILGGPPGGGGGFGGIGVPDFVDQKKKTMGRPSRLGGGASVMRRGGGGKAITRGIAKTFGRGAAKGAAKGFGKMGLKKIPGVGAIAGAAFAAERAMKGDWLGAGGELLSGLAGTIPGIGTGVSTAIDAGLMARDAGLTPFARGGIITQPTQGLVGEAGQEGVFPLEGARGKKTFLMFGEGVLNAQLDNKKEFAELQSRGLKQYYEREGGFEKMGNVLGDIFKGIGGFLANLGNGLLGGAANAAENPNGAADYLDGGIGGSTAERNAAAFLSTLEGGSGQTAADTFQVMLNRTANAKAGGSMKAYGSTLFDQITAKEQFSPFSAAIYGASADSAAAKKYGPITAALGKTPEERKRKLLEIAGQPDGIAALQKLFKAGSASAAAQVLKDFESGGAMSKSSAQFVGGAMSFRGYETSGSRRRSEGGNYFFGAAQGTKAASLNAVSAQPVASPGGDAGGKGGKIVEYLTGDRSHRGYRADHGGENYHEHLAFQTTEQRNRAMKVLRANGIQIGSINTGKHAKGSYHYQEKAFDVPAAQVPRGQEQALSQKVRAILSRAGFGGAGISAAPPAANTPATAGGEKPGSEKTTPVAGRPKTSPRASSASSPGSLQASAASPNTGTPMMAASQQVAMGTMGLTTGGGSPTIINNYYGGGGQSGGVNGNGVSPGIGMTDTGTSVFQDLRIRSLG